MTGKELSSRLHGDVRAKLQGALQVRSHKGVIYDEQRPVAVCQLRNGCNVSNLQGRVRGGLQEDGLHIGGEVIIGENRKIADEAGSSRRAWAAQS